MSAEPTDHISLGIVKRVKTESGPEGAVLDVWFWDRGRLVVRARFGEPLQLDLAPASLGQLVRPVLTDAVVDAFLANEPPGDPDRTARIRQRFERLGITVREGTIGEQREAILRRVQQEIHDGTASHACTEWRHGLRCEVCGQWLGEVSV